MNKSVLVVFLAILVICSLIVAGITLVNLAEDEGSEDKFYTFPIFVAEKTYVISIRSNSTSTPKVSYSGLDKIVSFDFMGDPENAYCNITIPTNLIWGELSVIAKYYKMSDDYYIESNNSTHTSIYFTFNQTALVKHFEIRGTEGVSDSFS